MAEQYTLGLNCTMYYNNGTHDIPDWIEVERVKDIKVNLDTDTDDASSRKDKDFKAMVPVQSDFKVDAVMVYNRTDSAQEALEAQWLAKASKEFLWLDGPLSEVGSKGWRATCIISAHNTNEPLTGHKDLNMTFQNTVSDYSPEQYEVVS